MAKDEFDKLHFYLLTNPEGRQQVFKFLAQHAETHGHIGGYKSSYHLGTQMQILMHVVNYVFPDESEEGAAEEQALSVRQQNEAFNSFSKTWEELTEAQQKKVTKKLESSVFKRKLRTEKRS